MAILAWEMSGAWQIGSCGKLLWNRATALQSATGRALESVEGAAAAESIASWVA